MRTWRASGCAAQLFDGRAVSPFRCGPQVLSTKPNAFTSGSGNGDDAAVAPRKGSKAAALSGKMTSSFRKMFGKKK